MVKCEEVVWIVRRGRNRPSRKGLRTIDRSIILIEGRLEFFDRIERCWVAATYGLIFMGFRFDLSHFPGKEIWEYFRMTCKTLSTRSVE